MIELGEILDDRSSSVQQEFFCPFCDLIQDRIEYDKEKNRIIVPKSVPNGAYRLKVTLLDNDELDPKSREYVIDIVAINPFNTNDIGGDGVESGAQKNGGLTQAELPYLGELEFSQFGLLNVRFSEKLKVPADLSRFNPEALDL